MILKFKDNVFVLLGKANGTHHPYGMRYNYKLTPGSQK